MTATLVPVAFGALPGWQRDDHAAALRAFQASARRFLEKPYPRRPFGPDPARFARLARLALGCAPGQARAFFEDGFEPLLIRLEGSGSRPEGFVTGFYEPVIEARLARETGFEIPIHAPPLDLVEIDDTVAQDGLPRGMRFARRTRSGFEPHFDRTAIARGALADQGLEIAWARDKVDLFFAHVQGAARLDLGDGTTARITYAAKSGHPFTGIGAVLVAMGELPADAVTMQTIRAWLAAHPDRVDEVLERNCSYIYFKFSQSVNGHPLDDALGPVAAAKVQLAPHRSIAVDRTLHSFGMPFFVSVPGLHVDGNPDYQRLMIAQDTGTAIVGPARADLFMGSGAEAGERAGIIRHPADLYLLVPR